MSDLRFVCPACGRNLVADSRIADRVVACPHCSVQVLPCKAQPLDIRFRCPACQSKLVIDRAAAGSSADCPRCGKNIRIPGAPSGDEGKSAVPTANAPSDPTPPPAVGVALTKEETDFLTRL